MQSKKHVFCYFWIKVIDEAALVREDADRLARAARMSSGGDKFDAAVIVDPQTSDRLREPVIVDPQTSDRVREPVIVDPQTSDRVREPVIVDPQTSDRVREPVIVDPQTSDRVREAVIVDPQTSDRSGGAVTQWKQDTPGATSITISAVPQGYVVADASSAYTTDCIALNQTFNEESARKWIETEEGRRWRGHAKVCVLHHAVVTIAS